MVQESLFIMAVGNSCANPIVYGSYAIDLKKECCRCFLPSSSRKANVDVNLIQRSLGNFKSTSTKKSCVRVSIKLPKNLFKAIIKCKLDAPLEASTYFFVDMGNICTLAYFIPINIELYIYVFTQILETFDKVYIIHLNFQIIITKLI
jgi:hypothetical protein